MNEEEQEIERRAIQRGKDLAEMEQLREEHVLLMAFIRDYRTILDKLYASKMTEVIVNTALKVVLLAVLAGALALVVKK